MAAFQVTGEAVILHGFTDLQRALDRICSKGDFGIDYELKRRLRRIGEKVGEDAARNVTHKTGRGTGELERSVKVSVTSRSASVYSTSAYGGIQNSGGGPHAGWAARGPHIRADKASHWMTKAVAGNSDFVTEELDGLLDWLIDEWEQG